MIEWYDFYIFGSLAPIIATQFFPKENPTAAFLATLAAFGVGFVIRPFGAIVFGRLGDIVGRKYTFLLTLLIMGGSTFAIGLIPSYDSIGIFAPILVFVLRALQGLALGGEYGGAAIYVAEHAPAGKKRILHQFHSNHSDPWFVDLTGGDPCLQIVDDSRRFWHMGLETAIFTFCYPCGHLVLYPQKNGGVSCV